MMPPNFPFFRFPMFYNPYKNPYYNNFQRAPYNNSGYSDNKTYQGTVLSSPSSNPGKFGDAQFTTDMHSNGNSKNNFSNNMDKENIASDSTRSSSEQFFDIFGIRLYFDDILILCLLFFLYQEEVQDQFLFIALLLLLLS